jgi:hypothetical protein
MIGEKISKIRSLLIASHFGPTVIVVTTSFILSVSQFSAASAAKIALAIFAGQLVVGWSNDLIDLPLDKAAGRESKPLVAGRITASFLKGCGPFCGDAALTPKSLGYQGNARSPSWIAECNPLQHPTKVDRPLTNSLCHLFWSNAVGCLSL